jgi:GT2 family glycosyltransferase
VTIDLVIPVYRGLNEVQRCIESVLGSPARELVDIVVIDDASPEAEVSAYLGSVAADGRIRLLRNATNLGFVGSVNRGLRLHTERDVILLNSDTQVAGDWVQRLRHAAHVATNIGTVTPFSNNATICSYPFQGWRGGVPGGLGLEALNKVFASENSGEIVDLPTAVGFCMYIRRDCLEQVGPFDEATFGRGYGEENDFCMRAATLGWRNVLATDVFVFHEGSVSFGSERFALMKTATEALLKKHPTYLDLVGSFLSRDPVDVYRARIDAARARMGSAEANHVTVESALKNAARQR